MRAGLNPKCRGSHLLRHSLATQMLRGGASLAEIGEVLRHQLPSTTEIYTKVDVTALRALALPWKGGSYETVEALEEYLALRRALGFILDAPCRVLHRFVAYAEHEGASSITTELALKWAMQPDCHPASGRTGSPWYGGLPVT